MSSKSNKYKVLWILAFTFTLPPWIILCLIRLISERPTSLDQNGVITEFIFYNYPLFPMAIALIASIISRKILFGVISATTIGLVIFTNHNIFGSYRQQYFRYNGWKITGYEILDHGVFFKTYPVKKADPNTFKQLETKEARRNYFWRDKDHLYLRGQKFHNADPNTFRVFSNNLARDKSNLYFSYHWEFRRGNVLPNIDFNSLEFFNERALCFRDQNGIYIGPKKLDYLDNFRWINCGGSNALGIARGKLIEYEFKDYDLPLIADVHEIPFSGDPESTRFSKDYRLLRDKSHIYIYNEQIKAYSKFEGLDPDTIEKIDTTKYASPYFRTGKRIFYFDYYTKKQERYTIAGLNFDIIELKDVNSESFKVHPKSLGYDGSDGQRFFYEGKEVSPEKIKAKKKEFDDYNKKRNRRYQKKKASE